MLHSAVRERKERNRSGSLHMASIGTTTSIEQKKGQRHDKIVNKRSYAGKR